MNTEDLECRFTYHRPITGQPEKYEKIRNTALEFSLLLNELCSDSRELSLAMTKLEESVMWANTSIARN